MKQTKRSYQGRLFYDFRGLERTLEEMAMKGWKLKKLNNFYIEYEKIDPQPLKYTVTYFWEASEFRPVPTENQEVFVDYCRESGWEFVAKWAQMLIFCSEEQHPTPIDTDPQEQLQAMHKTMKKGMLPSTYAQIGTFLLLVASRIYGAYTMPEYFYVQNSSVMMVVLFAACFLYYCSVPLNYFGWYRRAKKAVDGGGEIPSPRWSAKREYLVALGLFAGAVLYLYLQFHEQQSALGYVFTYGAFALFFVPLFWITGKLRKRGLLAIVWVRVLYVAVATVVSTGAIMTLIFSMITMGVFSPKTETPELDEPLPLTLEDISDVNGVVYSYENDVRQSFMLKWSDCRQRSEDYSQPWLDYEVFETDYEFVYNHILSDILRINSNERDLPAEYQTNWREMDLPGTTVAFQPYEGDRPRTYRYVLCYGTNIVDVRGDFTDDQLVTMAEMFGEKLN